MSGYPLFFNFKQVIPGKGFLAIIEAKGRVLLVQEDDKWWLYGVQPGGMAAYGETVEDGLRNFGTAFKNILLDIASESQTADEFKRAVRDFFISIDEEDANAWETARNELRSEKTKCPDDIGSLRKETSNFDSTIDIILIRKKDDLNIKKKDILPRDDLYQRAA